MDNVADILNAAALLTISNLREKQKEIQREIDKLLSLSSRLWLVGEQTLASAGPKKALPNDATIYLPHQPYQVMDGHGVYIHNENDLLELPHPQGVGIPDTFEVCR